MTGRERFLGVMEYKPVDRIPNHEVGVWPQTIERWKNEGLDVTKHNWNWFVGDEAFNMDLREYIPVNFGMVPSFTAEVLERTDRYEIIRHRNGVVTKALIDGTVGGNRASMDQYLSFPVENIKDFRELKKRYNPTAKERYPENWMDNIDRWNKRDNVLILGKNCSTLGFYWRAREWMGTENVCYAWYDEPELMHEMMEFIKEFTIEVATPVLDKVTPDYIFINEDMSMKNGPLLSPDTYKEFIYPHMRELVDFYKKKGVKYVVVDTDGNCEKLLPMLMETGIDGIWPLERAAGMDPMDIRKKFGKGLRLWGGVDKRELAKDKKAIYEHLKSLVPIVEDGGFIPTVDHLVPPDVSYENFLYYMEKKQELLQGRFK
jgi:hypothetical protein